MKSQTNIFILLCGLILLFFPLSGYSQDKLKVFYDEKGDEITQKIFYKSIDYRDNLDLYFENDPKQFGLLIRRQGLGILDKATFITLKTYLEDLSETQIGSQRIIKTKGIYSP